MSITKAVLRFAAPLPKIERFERFLFLGPHPDDIEIGAGATAAKLAAAGKQVTFLICTDGRYGLDYAPEGTTPEALIAIRQRESMASAKKLGVTDVRFLPFEDGGFYDEDELLRAVAAVIGEGNGNPLQCSCLENPRDGGAWWGAVYGVAQSRT